MSSLPSVPAGDSSFTPNPDFDLNVNAAAAAYEVDTRMNGLVKGLLDLNVSPQEALFGERSMGMTKREFVEGFRAWQDFLRTKEARQRARHDA